MDKTHVSLVRDSRKTQGFIIGILTDFDAVGRPAGMIRPGHVHHSIVRFYPLTDCTNLYFFSWNNVQYYVNSRPCFARSVLIWFSACSTHMNLPIFRFGCVFGLLLAIITCPESAMLRAIGRKMTRTKLT